MDDYEVVKTIGEGAYGRAVLCTHKESKSQVVIKEISMNNLSAKEQKEARKETNILGLLNHPNIIGYKGSFMQNGTFHIIMDYADGGDLFQQIQEAKGKHFPEDKILEWFVQICLALKHIHDRKILHRDIKCQNIFLTKNGVVKMGDFGIAKVLDHTSQFCKTAIGTPYYLSPEICQGKNYNAKSDIWSLGCVLYELCTLQHAFDSNCMNGLIMKILRAKHAPIPYYYSTNLRNLVDNMLQKLPSKRPTINAILKLDFIWARIHHLLSETQKKMKFCHTVIHGPISKGNKLPAISEEKPENVPSNENNDQHVAKSKIPVPIKLKPKPSESEQANNDNPIKHPPSKLAERKPSKEDLQNQKCAPSTKEREREKYLRERREQEKSSAERKRKEIKYKTKQKGKDRKNLLIQLMNEDRERRKHYESLEAPFKKAMAPGAVPARKHEKPAKDDNDNDSSPREEPKPKPRKSEKEITKRPGQSILRREEEVISLREIIAKRRAEMRKKRAEEAKDSKEDSIRIGSMEFKISPVIEQEEITTQSEAPPNVEQPEDQKTSEIDIKTDEEKPKDESKPPLNTLDALIHISDDEDTEDEETNDLISLVAIAENIFDHPPSSDEGEEEEDKNEANSKENKSKHFYFGGKELILPMVTDKDSMNYRIEAIRIFIEDGLGIEKFIECYQFMTEQSDNLEEHEADLQLRKILSTPDQLSYYPLIQQLIVCEENDE